MTRMTFVVADTAADVRSQQAKHMKHQLAASVHKKLVVNPSQAGELPVVQEEVVPTNIRPKPNLSFRNLFADGNLSASDREKRERRGIRDVKEMTVAKLYTAYQTKQDHEMFFKQVAKEGEAALKMVRIAMATSRGENFQEDAVANNNFVKSLVDYFQGNPKIHQCQMGLKLIFRQMPLPKFNLEKARDNNEDFSPLETLKKEPSLGRIPARQPVAAIPQLMRPPSGIQRPSSSAGAVRKQPAGVKKVVAKEVERLHTIKDNEAIMEPSIRKRLNNFTSDFCISK